MSQTQATAQTAGRYEVRCHECLTTVRRTDSLHESACGSMCQECRKGLDYGRGTPKG